MRLNLHYFSTLRTEIMEREAL